MTCQSCGEKCFPVLDLGKQPICNAFLKSKSDFRNEKFYPLELVYCPNCTLLQLGEVLPNSLVFGNGFTYLSGATVEAVEYFEDLSNKLIRTFDLKEGDWVVDIGSNDGTFLKNFAERGINVIGVEPARQPYEVAMKNGIDTINKPFEDCVGEIEEKAKGKIKLVTAINVVAHTDKVHQFLEGVFKLCRRNYGAFVSQSQYLPDLVEKNEWDMIYHEHARYYTGTSLSRLLWSHNLPMYDTQRVPYYGGSFVAYSSLNFDTVVTDRFSDMLEKEAPYGSYATYRTFAENVRASKRKLNRILADIMAGGKEIAAVGAPMKSSTLLNYCGIDWSTLQYLAEVNDLKVGTFSPGMHIPVTDERKIFHNPPDYLLVLAWNVSYRIMEEYRKRGYKGKFIIPFPEVKIL
jgi:hypothetical protein